MDNPNPYFLAFLTACLSGIFAIAGFYFTAKFQASNAIKQKQFEYKASAYESFLKSVHKEKSPVIAEIFNIGRLADHVATDGEIQAIEDAFGRLSKLNYEYKISWQLDSDFALLRLHGSVQVKQYCEDILTVLALREHDVDWKYYSQDIQSFRDKWAENQNGIAYGWDEKVTNEERLMFILLAKLFKNLVTQLNSELHD